jgi:deoxyguanosine kinase
MSAARHIAIEGPLRVGKSSLAKALAGRISARTVLDTEDNPYLEDFYKNAPGAALRTQMHFLFERFKQLREVARVSSITPIVSDYIFEKDKLFAYLNLTDDEAAVYDNYYQYFHELVTPPDLVIYLKATPEVLRERIERKGVSAESKISSDYLQETVRAYEHFFTHYRAADVLVVDTTKVDFVQNEADLEELLQELSRPVHGTQFFLPLGS